MALPLHLQLVLALSLLRLVASRAMKSPKSAKGTALIALFVWLTVLSAASMYSYEKWIHYKAKYDNQSVVKLVDSLMPVLNNYYRTECYANAGVVAASLSLNDLKTAGYIQSTFPSPIKGTLELQIDTSTTYAQLLIIMERSEDIF